MARFFVAKGDIQDGRAKIAGAELRHLRNVLRLGPGDSVTLFDETGWEHEAVVRGFGADFAELSIRASIPAQRESPLEIALAVALTKGDKLDWVVEKATELGVATIASFASRYSVPKLDRRKAAQRVERWRKIALNAAKQCGRTRVPAVPEIVDFQEVIRRPPPETVKVLLWEKEARKSLVGLCAERAGVRSVVLLIGPEGGFADEEADEAKRGGFTAARLGTRILRAETAAIAAVAIVQSLWGDLA